MNTSTNDADFRLTEYRDEIAKWGDMKTVEFSAEDGLEIHSLEFEMEALAESLGIDLDELAAQAGRHFQSDSIVRSSSACSESQLDQIVNDELEAFRH